MELGNANKNFLGLKDEKSKYYTEDINLDDENSHSKIVKYIADDSVVFDVGCSSGLIGKYLHNNKNCTVYGCDIDSEAINNLKKKNVYKELFVKDLDNDENFDNILKKHMFDYIILADVLEHLKDPGKVILKLKQFLKIGGKMIISLPNIAHINIITNLIDGNFNYSQLGILDNTHLRFFTKKSFIRFISNLNTMIKDGNYFKCNIIDKVLIPDNDTKFTDEFLNIIKNEESEVLQYIYSISLCSKDELKNSIIFENNIHTINKKLKDNKIYELDKFNYQNEINNKLKKENNILNIRNNELISQNKDLKVQNESLNRIVNLKLVKMGLALNNRLYKIIPPNGVIRKLILLPIKVLYKIINRIFKVLFKKFVPKKIKQLILYRVSYSKKLSKLLNMPINNYREIIVNDNNESLILDEVSFKQSIAVHLHLYYKDLTNEFINYLKNIPYTFDLYISTFDSKNNLYIKRKFNKIINCNKVIIKKTENCGRDYGPMFFAFGEDLKKYKYVLHIHTKKSLRMGHQQDEWRRYLLDSVLGSKSKVIGIINLLNQQNTGMIIQDDYKDIPYWAHSWLKASECAHKIYNRLGLNFNDKYFNCSMGSMFWIKNECIKELYELSLKEEDFNEFSDNDETSLAYVLERLCGDLVCRKGYDYYSVSLDGKFNFNKQNKNFGMTKKMTKKDFYDKLNCYKVISFDIFDTLITRKVIEPNYIYNILETKIKEQGINLPERLIDLRKKAEQSARENLKKDVNIHEIYDEFYKLAEISKEVANYIMNEEINLELQLCIPRIDMLKIYNKLIRQNKQIILISDMYLPKDIIAKILNKCGYHNYFELLVSCDINKRKDSGTMYDYYYDNYGFLPTIHVGDNEESDIHSLLLRGKDHYHILSSKRMFEISDLNYEYNLTDSDKIILGLITNKGLFNSPFAYTKKMDHYKYGYVVLAPLILNFMIWLNKKSKDYDRLVFFAREGYLLEKIYNILFPNDETKYLLISRRTITVANIKNKDDILEILKPNYTGSIKSLFYNRLGININCKNIKVNPSIDTDIIKKEISKNLKQILNQAVKEKNNYLSYLKKEFNDIDFEKTLCVDLGYSGTSQYELSKLLNKKIDAAYFIVSDNLKPISLGCKIYSCYNNVVYDNSFDKNPVGKYSLFLEGALTAPCGQLICFDDYGNPKYLFDGDNKKKARELNKIYEGIIDFINDFMEINKLPIDDINISNDLILHLFKKIIKNVQLKDDLLNTLKVEDMYCSDEILDLNMSKK